MTSVAIRSNASGAAGGPVNTTVEPGPRRWSHGVTSNAVAPLSATTTWSRSMRVSAPRALARILLRIEVFELRARGCAGQRVIRSGLVPAGTSVCGSHSDVAAAYARVGRCVTRSLHRCIFVAQRHGHVRSCGGDDPAQKRGGSCRRTLFDGVASETEEVLDHRDIAHPARRRSDHHLVLHRPGRPARDCSVARGGQSWRRGETWD